MAVGMGAPMLSPAPARRLRQAGQRAAGRGAQWPHAVCRWCVVGVGWFVLAWPPVVRPGRCRLGLAGASISCGGARDAGV